jgi:leader peptidase (prepilin peptidase) / N-methyltransferase
MIRSSTRLSTGRQNDQRHNPSDRYGPPVMFPVVVATLIAAFLPRVACRLAVPHGTPPRPACADCSRPFPPGLRGWVRLGAPCPCAAMPWRPLISTAVAAGVTAPVLMPAVLLGVLLAEIDFRCLRLPDPLVAALAVAVLVPLTIVDGSGGRLGRAAVAAGVVLLLHLVIALLPGGGLGLGDVKLAGVLGLLLGWTGWPAVLIGLALPHLLNAPVVLILLIRRRIGRRTPVPFGPALLAGAFLAVVTTGA